MWQQYTIKWLWLLLLAILSGCSGGGAFEATDTDSGAAGGGTGDTIDTTQSGTLFASGPVIVPAGVPSATVKIAARDANSLPMSGIPLTISAVSDTGTATVSQAAVTTDSSGNAQVDISADYGTVTVSVGVDNTQGSYNFTGGGSFNIEFGVSISSTTVVDNPQLANGLSSVKVQVRVQNSQGFPLAGVPAALRFEENSSAFPLEAVSATNDNGLFNVEVASFIAGSTTVTPVIDGYPANPATLDFIASTAQNPTSLDVTVVNNPALPDGNAAINLIAVARDAAGAPISEVAMAVVSNSSTAVIDNLVGNTGGEAKFEFAVTNTVSEDVVLTITAGEGGGAITTTQVINFRPNDANSTVSIIRTEVSGNADGTLANGVDSALVTVTVLDASGTPISGVNVGFVVPIAELNLSPISGTTDEAGRFITRVSSQLVGTHRLDPIVNGRLYTGFGYSATLSFQSADPVQGVVPSSIEFNVSNAPQPADGMSPVNVFVTVRDANNTPMNNVRVALSSPSSFTRVGRFGDNVNFLTGNYVEDFTEVTGATAFIVTSQQAGSINLTASLPDYEVASQTQEVTFSEQPISTAPIASVTLTSDLLTQIANGQDAIEIAAIVRDAQGIPISDVNVSLATNPVSSNAVFGEASGVTGNNGVFSTTVTNTKIEFVNIIATATKTNGVPVQSAEMPLQFVADSGSGIGVVPTALRLEVVGSPAVPDGNAQITVRTLAFDAAGKALPNANVDLEITALDQPAPLFVFTGDSSGPTANNGAFDTALTSTTAGTLQLTAVSGAVRSNTVTLRFAEATEVTEVATLRLDVVGSPALPSPNGEEQVAVRVFAFDKNGKLLPEIPITLETKVKSNPGPLFVFVGGNAGPTADNGAFDTAITSSTEGELELTAVSGGVRSTSATVKFVVDAANQPSSLTLLTSNSELPSHDPAEGVVITALVKTAANTPFVDQKVNFSVDSGLITPLLSDGATAIGLTNQAGNAQARLSTGGNASNRNVTVRAQVDGADCAKPEEQALCKELVIQITGTKLNISTSASKHLVCKVSNYVLTLTDADDKTIANQTIELNLTGNAGSVFVTNTDGTACPLPNTGATQTLTTDAQGRISVVIQSTSAGNTTLTASSLGTSANTSFTVEDVGEIIAIAPLYADTGTGNEPYEVKLFTAARFGVRVDQMQQFKPITVSTTRGHLAKTAQDCDPIINTAGFPGINPNELPNTSPVPNSVLTIDPNLLPNLSPIDPNFEYNAEFYICSNNLGPASVNVQTEQGTTQNMQLNFVPKQAEVLTIQANPPSIAPNSLDSDTQQSEIIVVARDKLGNLVPNQTIFFVVEDQTGGYLAQSSAVTDRFGRATTVYIAGNSTSAAGGVKVTASVAGTSPQPVSVTLTVGQRAAFIILGTGNSIAEDGNTRYTYPYTALVTDVEGKPIANASISLSAIPKQYAYGCRVLDTVNDRWATLETYVCNNNDLDRDALLDQSEFFNNNNMLDPRNVATFQPSSIVTDENGFADFNVLYPQEYAHYILLEIKATTVVTGSESIAVANFELKGLDSDFAADQAPPGPVSPYGVAPNLPLVVPPDFSCQLINDPAGCF